MVEDFGLLLHSIAAEVNKTELIGRFAVQGFQPYLNQRFSTSVENLVKLLPFIQAFQARHK